MHWHRQLNTYIRSPRANFENCSSVLFARRMHYAADPTPFRVGFSHVFLKQVDLERFRKVRLPHEPNLRLINLRSISPCPTHSRDIDQVAGLQVNVNIVKIYISGGSLILHEQHTPRSIHVSDDGANTHSTLGRGGSDTQMFQFGEVRDVAIFGELMAHGSCRRIFHDLARPESRDVRNARNLRHRISKADRCCVRTITDGKGCSSSNLTGHMD